MDTSLSERLLPWYGGHRRDLAFRRTRDPYAILVAEVLLQRTRVVSGVPYYERFIARFPTVGALAAASEEEVLKAWEGLGFYGRARNLHRAARAVVAVHGGRIPSAFAELRELSGIGDYTAGAVASIAFGERVPAVDGNAARVLARVFRLGGDLTRGAPRRRLMEIAASLVPAAAAGAYNQALMELGATVCRPRSPRCPACPLEPLCGARADGQVHAFPEVRPRASPPRVRVAFALATRGDDVLLVRRPPGGLLAGLWALPGGEVPPRASDAPVLRRALAEIGLEARLGRVAGRVEHTFSHRHWEGRVIRVRVAGTSGSSNAIWAGPEDLRRLPVVPFHRRFLERVASSPADDSRVDGFIVAPRNRTPMPAGAVAQYAVRGDQLNRVLGVYERALVDSGFQVRQRDPWGSAGYRCKAIWGSKGKAVLVKGFVPFGSLMKSGKRLGAKAEIYQYGTDVVLRIAVVPYMELFDRPEVFLLSQGIFEKITDDSFSRQKLNEVLGRIAALGVRLG